MGKLIKNHWARLIVLTASICTSHILSLRLPPSNSPLTKFPPNRPNRRRSRRILLAQGILGLSNHQPRPRRPPHPHPANPKPPPWYPGPRLGMALAHLRLRRNSNASEHRSPIGGIPLERASGTAVVPRNEPRDILSHWVGCVFLGVQ